MASTSSLGIEVPDMEPHFEGEPARKRRRTSAPLHREVGLMRIPGDKFSGFVGSASGIYFIRSVYGAIRPTEPTSPAHMETPGSDVVPGEDDRLSAAQADTSDRLWRAAEIDPQSRGHFTFDELVEWTGSYFANWQPLYPFLHAPTVLGYFQTMSTSGLPSRATHSDFRTIIVRSVMSISLADHRQSHRRAPARYPAQLVFHSYDDAVNSLQHVLSKPTSILGLQAAISVQLFLVSMLRLNAASRLGGLISRMAFQLGLHRCAGRFSSFSTDDKQLRQRLFWSLYAIDRFICQSMGLPLGIADDDVDVCFPTAEMHASETDIRSDPRLLLIDFVARESRLRGEIIELRNKSVEYVHKDPDKATAISAKLAEWWNRVESLSDAEEECGISQYHLTILTLLKHESIISLHRPILAASRRGADYDAALHLCIGSARSIITTLHKSITPSAQGRSELGQMTLLWPSCTWAVWISTFILFYAASGDYLTREVVTRLADRSLQVLQHLARRGSNWPEASAAAIRDLRHRLVEPRNDQAQMAIDTRWRRDSQMGQVEEYASAPISAPTQTNITDATGYQSSSRLYGLSDVTQHGEMRNAGPSATDSSDFLGPSRDAVADMTRNQSTADENDGDMFHAFMNENYVFEQDLNAGLAQNPDPFSGFDIPFWFDQDQHWDIFQDFN
ncbi:fungal-specific transcription factor domain-containing protein [Paraphoma chrysanthemicola]|nr:fungal-specific transcription factor domain-containing protein [Paraphoma chrysanthemicola]